jgi:peptidyl-prolyl cis-trans isomerase SurA
MTKIKGIMIVALVLVLVQLGLTRTGSAKVVDRIVAEVNNDIITMSELRNMQKSYQAQTGIKPTEKVNKHMQREMLEALIDRKLAKEEAKRRGIKVNPMEVQEALNRFKQRNNIPDDATLAKGLANEGLTLKEFKQQIADQLTQDQLLAMTVRSKIVVSDAEVRRVYNERFKKSGTQLHILSLRLPFPPGATEAQKDEVKHKAETVLIAVKRGESFRQAAKQLSLKVTDVGYVSQNDLDPRLADYLKKLKPMEVGPVATPGGFQLIQVVGHRSGEGPSFEEVAPQIRQMLTHREMQKEFTEWVKTLREKAHIKIML